MTIYETIKARMREMKAQGMTDVQIAQKAGCTQQHINRMLNRPTSYLETVSHKTIVRLFPDLFATSVSIGNANGTNNVTNVSIGTKDNSALIAAIINDDDICDKCKVKVLKLITSK